MITRVEITLLRGIRHGLVDGLSRLDVLVGPNGCGKSTVLDAMLIGLSDEAREAVARTIRRRAELVSNQAPRYSPEWLVHGGAVDTEAEILLGFEGDADRLRPTTLAYGNGSVVVRSNAETGPVSNFAAGANLRGDRGRLRAPPIELIDPLEDATTPLAEVYSNAARRGRASFANRVLGDLIRGFEKLEILSEHGVPILYMHVDGAPVPVSLAGEGVVALVRTTLELAACADHGTALLEEPEIHQHPRSLRLMSEGITAAVKRGVQVVLTTHSLELIELLLASAAEAGVLDQASVHVVRLRGGELTAARLPGDSARFQISEIGEDLR